MYRQITGFQFTVSSFLYVFTVRMGDVETEIKMESDTSNNTAEEEEKVANDDDKMQVEEKTEEEKLWEENAKEQFMYKVHSPI